MYSFVLSLCKQIQQFRYLGYTSVAFFRLLVWTKIWKWQKAGWHTEKGNYLSFPYQQAPNLLNSN